MGSKKFIQLSISTDSTTSFGNQNNSNMGNATSWLPDEKNPLIHPYGQYLWTMDRDFEKEAKVDIWSLLGSLGEYFEDRKRNIREANFSDELNQHFEFYLLVFLLAILFFALLIVTVDCLGAELRRCRNKRRGYEPMHLVVSPSV